MIDLSKETHSLTEFQGHTAVFIDHLKRTKQAMVLTVEGKAELVVQDAQSYEKLLEAAELLETLKGINNGLEQMKQGKGEKAEDFFTKLLNKLDSLP